MPNPNSAYLKVEQVQLGRKHSLLRTFIQSALEELKAEAMEPDHLVVARKENAAQI